jgi:lipid A 3-O-deacylase PagL
LRIAALTTYLLTLAFVPSTAHAQSAVADPPATEQVSLDASRIVTRGASEWMATVGSAWGVVVFNSAGGHQYMTQTLSWGRVLSGPKFSGALRGRFEWSFETTPVYAQYHPDRVYGVGVSPLLWRWNFEPRGRYAPFAQLGGGLLWTTRPVPQRTTTANFTANIGVGLRMLLKSRRALVVMYRFDHISNGNRLERNPGVNAHALHLGFSLLHPRQQP